MYDNFLQLYKKNEYKIKHGNKDYIKSEWIEYVEKELGFPLPESYKWWLSNFEYFIIDNVMVKRIINPHSTIDDKDSDILYSYKKGLEEKIIEANELCILHTGKALYYFLVEPHISNNEYRIYCRDYISEDDDFYADNFLKFIEMKIYEI